MIPSVYDPRWRSVVTGAISFQPRMLAAQILMGRLRLSVQRDQSQTNVSRAVSDLRAFFEKYEMIAASDLAQIFG
jgi:hypothetical protein